LFYAKKFHFTPFYANESLQQSKLEEEEETVVLRQKISFHAILRERVSATIQTRRRRKNCYFYTKKFHFTRKSLCNNPN